MKSIIIGIVGIIIIGAGIVLYRDIPSHTEQHAFSVVTSFYPLYFFTQELVGDTGIVRNVTPAGSEPHDYEPTPNDLIAMTGSDVIILNGGGFEPWEHDIEDTLSVPIIRAG